MPSCGEKKGSTCVDRASSASLERLPCGLRSAMRAAFDLARGSAPERLPNAAGIGPERKSMSSCMPGGACRNRAHLAYQLQSPAPPPRRSPPAVRETEMWRHRVHIEHWFRHHDTASGQSVPTGLPKDPLTPREQRPSAFRGFTKSVSPQCPLRAVRSQCRTMGSVMAANGCARADQVARQVQPDRQKKFRPSPRHMCAEGLSPPVKQLCHWVSPQRFFSPCALRATNEV